jgi:hypothetical protein
MTFQLRAAFFSMVLKRAVNRRDKRQTKQFTARFILLNTASKSLLNRP